jgi:hypothetical protein
MKPRIRYLAGLVAPAAGPALRPPRQLFDAGTYQPAHSPVSNLRQRAGGHAGPDISGGPVPVPGAVARPSLPEISQPGDRPAADRAFTAPAHSRTPGPPPAAGSSLAPDLVPSSGAPAIPGTAPAPSVPSMAAAPGSAAPRGAGEGTGPATGARAVGAGQEKPGRPWIASHPAGAARTGPPPAGAVPPPASAAQDPAPVRSERPPSGHSWSLADAAVAPGPESRSGARQGGPAGLPPASGPVPEAGDRPTAPVDRGIVPGRPGGPGAFPDLLPPPAPAPQLTVLPQPDTGGLRHRSRPPQPHRVSIGTIEVTVVPPAPAPPAHRIPPPARPAPVPSRRASQLDGSGGPRFRRWYGTAQS